MENRLKDYEKYYIKEAMETTFNQAADPFESLRKAIEEHAVLYPDSKIRDVETALKHMNAVFVSPQASRLQEYGTDAPNGRYQVGVSCGDGRDTFFIDVGLAEERGRKIARHLCWYNADMKVLTDRAPQPFIAVNPQRIGSVFEDRGNIVFCVRDSQNAFSVLYGDDHRASIDAFLLENKLIQARSGNVHLSRPSAVKSVDGKVIALPFGNRHKGSTPT